MHGAVRSEPERRPCGLCFGVLSLLHLPELVFRFLVRNCSRRAADAIRTVGSSRYTFRGNASISSILLGVLSRLGRTVSHYPLLEPHSQEWISWVPLYFAFVIASSLCVLVVVRPLWNRKPQSWLWAVIQAFFYTFLIYFLTALTFWWMLVYVVVPLAPLVHTWNACGLVWALVVGTWRWHTLRSQPASALRESAG